MPEEDWTLRDRAHVEMIASALTTGPGRIDLQQVGQARAELIRRDREYTEKQEQSRRQFEQGLFNEQGKREVQRREFEKGLAQTQSRRKIG